MTVHQEWIDLVEIASFSQALLSGAHQLRKVQRATWAVEEIRRLRAKTNRLIRVINEEDADGDHICNARAMAKDLILEEEI